MKLSTLVLGIVAAACAAASIYLGSELAAARDELAQADRARAADQARIRQLESERRRFDVVAASPGPAIEGAPAPGALLPDQEQRPVANLNPGVSPPTPPVARTASNEPPRADPMRRTQQEIRLRRLFADMPTALGLDAKQADALFDLLADSRVNSYEDARAYAGDPLGRQAIESAARQQRDAAIDALLGPDKAAEFLAFEKSIPARMQVNRIAETMAAANAPLSEAQRNSLVAAVAAEQEAFPRPERAADGSADADYESKFLAWQAEYSRRVQRRVEPLLSSQQAAQYRAVVEAQNARRANRRANLEQRRNGTSPN